MDERVRAAMARWPNVPDIFGWLSLTQSGQWRLHPAGDAHQAGPDGKYPPGESISNPQILGFINRNYTHDSLGRWYFQNGPQRVFVRIDEAPLLLRTVDDGLTLQAHTGAPVNDIDRWVLDDTGHLYASTRLGPGLVAGRDLIATLEGMKTIDGHPIDFEAIMARAPSEQTPIKVTDAFHPAGKAPVELEFCPAAQIEASLGFVRNPALGYA